MGINFSSLTWSKSLHPLGTDFPRPGENVAQRQKGEQVDANAVSRRMRGNCLQAAACLRPHQSPAVTASPVRGKSFLKGRALGSPRKVHLFANASPSGRGGSERSELTERASKLKFQQCPKPQLGQWHTSQFRHKPPSPNRAMSSAVMGSSASRRGSSRSKMVRLAYMTQPGRPHTGTPSR